MIVRGEFESTFEVTVHDEDALRAYMALYPEQWAAMYTIVKAVIWQSHAYNEREDVAGTDGFADLPEGIVTVRWEEPSELSIYHEGEWW